ncbi:MAG: hypothetical protein WKG32_15015, partial [Gemmatimonadaceae bacterium]
DTQQAINLALYGRFEEERIEFAFPTRTVIVRQMHGSGAARALRSEPTAGEPDRPAWPPPA